MYRGGPCGISSLHMGIAAGMVIIQVSLRQLCCWDFTGMASLPCFEDSISCQASWSSGSYGLLTSSSIMFPEPYMEGLIVISIFYFWINFVLCVWMFYLHVCMCTMGVPGAHRTQRRVSGPLELDYRWWRATIWVVETESGFSPKATITLKPWAVSLAFMSGLIGLRQT